MVLGHANAMHGLALKGITVGALTLLGLVIDEKTGIPIGVACVFAMVWIKSAWWMGRKIQRVDDELYQAKQDRAAVYEALKQDRADFKETVKEIFTRMNNLPCNSCPPNEPHDKRRR